MSAETLLIAGTASHVGKSTVAAGLCRLLADRGFSVAPYKAQNMSNNAHAVPRTNADGPPFGEIGVSQAVQARAARVSATTDMNPVLLKPRGDGESQLVLDGVGVGHFAAGSYYDDHWKQARETARSAHDRLASEHEVIVAEGAGSIAEINLHHRDLANVETARFAEASIVLAGDIERGGVFASLVGTLELMPDDLREQVCGVIITKFRGDPSLLEPGLDAFEKRTDVPVLGVIPYDDPGLPEEDSVSLPAEGERKRTGADDGVPPESSVTIAVPRFPRASNMTDLEPLARVPGVRIVYTPLDDDLSDADALILSGTKNTVNDLLALYEQGMAEQIRSFDGPIVGLCGGYQMLGEKLTAVHTEATSETDTDDCLAGLGLLPVETRFFSEKQVRPATLTVDGVGPLAGVSGTVTGYEIHTGETTAVAGEAVDTRSLPFGDADTDTDADADADADVEARVTDRSPALGYCSGSVLGTYLHGLFENEAVRDGFVAAVYRSADRSRPDIEMESTDPYDRAAALIEKTVSLEPLFEKMKI